MKLFDTHFHFYEDNGTPKEYMKKIETPELSYLMAVGADLSESRIARDFAYAVDNSWYAVGVHPGAAKSFGSIAEFDEFGGDEKLKAVGEIGLDYFYDDNPSPEKQRMVMETFLAKALEFDLPAVIHCRDKQNKDAAFLDVYNMLKDYVKDGGQFELHCFAGSSFWLEKFAEMGGYFGVGGIVTFNAGENIRKIVKELPIDRILLETDSPYLAPVPYRGKPNNPGYMIETAKKVAELRNITVEECAQITTENSFKFFQIEGCSSC